MRTPFLRGVTVGGVVVGVALSATAAFAGTGIGAIFNLGSTNTVDQATVLEGTTTSSLLQVVNKGNAPALALNVPAGAVPFTVNSATKVKNLNADQIDGLDSSRFVRGPGGGRVQQVLRARTTKPLNSGNGSVLSVPKFGSLEASCGAGGTPNYRVFWRNSLSHQTVNVWFGDSATATTYISLAAGAGTYVAPVDGTTDRTVTITTGAPNGTVATVTVSMHASVGGCIFYAQSMSG